VKRERPAADGAAGGADRDALDGALDIANWAVVQQGKPAKPHQWPPPAAGFTVAVMTPLGRQPRGPATVVCIASGAAPEFATDPDVLQAMRQGRAVIALCVDPADALAIGEHVKRCRAERMQ
jgi:hypothetical protein